MTTKIKATNIWKKFNNLEVLKGIDLEVNEGEVVAVIGPSGGGKSTLLRCLNKLETIDKGSITIDGEELCRETSGRTEYVKNNDVRRIACKMGMVFQQFNLFPHMTVLENLIEAPVNVQKRDKAEVIKEAEVLLAKVGLSEKRDVYPRKLSGGQQQRVAIARALAMKPAIMLFDEPTIRIVQVRHVGADASGEHAGSYTDRARPIPVLPLVPSTAFWPAFPSLPSLIRVSIISRAIRSLIDMPGFIISSFT